MRLVDMFDNEKTQLHYSWCFCVLCQSHPGLRLIKFSFEARKKLHSGVVFTPCGLRQPR